MLNYSFDWSVLWRHPYGELFLNGILTTLWISLLAWMIALVLGVLVGVSRVSPHRWARFAGSAYVQVFRNIPFLVQLFFWYFAAPLLLPKPAQHWLYDNVPNFSCVAGVIALGAYTASRVAEQLRSGLLAIPGDQYRAAYSTGLTTLQTYRYVIVPYAVRLIMPPLTTEFLTCFKNSALTMTIGVMETTHTARYIESFTFHGIETTTAACLVYMGITLSVVLVMSFIEKKSRIRGMLYRRQ